MTSFDDLKTSTKILVALLSGLIVLEITFLPKAADWKDYAGMFISILVLGSIFWVIFNEKKIQEVFAKRGVIYWSLLISLLAIGFVIKNISTLKNIAELF